MDVNRLASRLVAIVLIAMLQSPLAAAQSCNLVGQSASLTLAGSPTPVNAVVQAGAVEFAGLPNDGRFSIDVESGSIRMFNNTSNTNVLFNGMSPPYTVTFGRLTDAIAGVTVTINGVSGLANDAVSFNANSVTIAPAGSVWNAGTSIVLTLQIACPPCGSLIGQQASLTLAGSPTPVNALVQAGAVEFAGLPNDGRFSIDVESSSIRMLNNTSNTNVLFNGISPPYTVTFDQLAGAITGVGLSVNEVSGLADNAVSFNGNSVTIAPAGSAWNAGTSIVITVQIACLQPEELFLDGFEAP